MLNEAALSAVRRGGQEIIQSDVYTAVDRVVQVGHENSCRPAV